MDGAWNLRGIIHKHIDIVVQIKKETVSLIDGGGRENGNIEVKEV